tara:strand:- start:2398 stop:2619 length:222 start_codon:yes stop_codon:yes gene_type:complete
MKDYQRHYWGWDISGPSYDEYDEFIGPVTGAWRAKRFGVGMGANTYEMLLSMIQTKVLEEQESGWNKPGSRIL